MSPIDRNNAVLQLFISLRRRELTLDIIKILLKQFLLRETIQIEEVIYDLESSLEMDSMKSECIDVLKSIRT